MSPVPVAVVTDSTSSLPPGAADDLGIAIVPLRVDLGGRHGTDGVDVSPADVTAALRRRDKVTTSRPSPGEFAAAFESAFAAGATHVVSVHLSSRLSGTWDSARLAAQEFPYGAVRVVDSRSTAMALGFAAMAAAQHAATGAGAGEVQDAAVSTVDATTSLLYVDSLEYLRRGGRIGAAAALLGTSLSIKPLLQVRDGQIVPLEKVRTSAKAVARLVQIVAAKAGSARVDVAVQHLSAPGPAAALAAALRSAVADLGDIFEAEIGPVVGAHLGPGTLGVVLVRRS